MQNIMFSFVCVCVSVGVGVSTLHAANYLLHFWTRGRLIVCVCTRLNEISVCLVEVVAEE